MKNLVIDESKNHVYIADYTMSVVYQLGTILNALGNVINVLEETFPKGDYLSTDYIVDSIFGKDGSLHHATSTEIWGFQTTRTILTTIYSFLGDGEKAEVGLMDIEDMRIFHRYRAFAIPLDINNRDKGYRFEVSSVNDVIFSLFYYYAINNLKLRKCAHCGRWFATKSFKYEYCSRKSPIEKYNHLECRKAVKHMKKKLGERKTAIYNSWYSSGLNYDRINELIDTYHQYLDTPSVENLMALNDYLYADDKPKQRRANRKKGGDT